MKHFSKGSVVALVLATVAAPHLEARLQDKMDILRKHLGAPDSAVIKASIRPQLPEGRPLRVALAFGLDVEIVKNFVKWVKTDWNDKGDAAKYGPIELVDDVGSAQVVLVRFLVRDAEVGSRSSGSVGTLLGDLAARSETKGVVPLQAYILKKTTAGFDVLGGYETTTTLDGSGGTGRSLWDEFKKLMKSR